MNETPRDLLTSNSLAVVHRGKITQEKLNQIRSGSSPWDIDCFISKVKLVGGEVEVPIDEVGFNFQGLTVVAELDTTTMLNIQQGHLNTQRRYQISGKRGNQQAVVLGTIPLDMGITPRELGRRAIGSIFELVTTKNVPDMALPESVKALIEEQADIAKKQTFKESKAPPLPSLN